MRMRCVGATSLLGMCLVSGADARLAISGNDGKQLQKGEDGGVLPDSISVIDLNGPAPKVIGSLQVPAAMIGPPEAVVVSRDEKFAIVTAAQKVDPTDPMKPLDNDQ